MRTRSFSFRNFIDSMHRDYNKCNGSFYDTEKAMASSDNKTGAEQVRWDLSFIYSSVDDPQLDTDVRSVIEIAKRFNADHKGNLATQLGKAIADYSEIDMLSNKIGVYLFLSCSADLNDEKVKTKMAKVERQLAEAAADHLNFFDHELVALSDATIASLTAADPVVAKHRPWIDLSRVFKPHLLAEEVEAALMRRLPFGPGSWSEFFDEFEADLRFEYRGEKKDLTQMLHLMTEEMDPAVRAEALKIVNTGLGGHFAKYSAQTLYMVAGKKALEDKDRKYRHPMESRNKSSQIPDAVVDTLHAAVTQLAAPLARRFYRLKAAHLDMKTLRWSDRNAKMPFADTSTVPWDEAVKTVLSAYESFSPTLAKLVASMLDQKRIDAPAAKGKRSGAYNYSIMLPGQKPTTFVFLNYLGSNRDVMTIAHEVGHGVHGLLAAEAQGPLMFHAPTAYAETASVFGEMTTFNHLRRKLEGNRDVKSQLALVMGKLDDMMNTVVRQIGFSNFERRLHGASSGYSAWEEVGKRSSEELDGIWLETAQELYGAEGEVFTYEDSEHLWSYISHFHRPFYVYGYAFGELLTQSLYAQQARLGDKFEPLYLELLRSGGTKDVVQLLKPFGLDPTDEKFWAGGIAVSLEALVSEAERLSAQMGVSV